MRLAIGSVADQEDPVIEHIVQDGGTNGIGDVFEAEFPELMKEGKLGLFVEKDSGMYDAVNRGLSKASGDVCAYLNCDEQYLPGTLSRVMSYFARHENVEVIFGDAILVNQQGIPLTYRLAILPTVAHLRLTDLNTLTCATFFRRRLFQAGHRFPTHLKIAGDQYWIFQLLKAGVKMAVLQEPLSIFTFTGDNLSRGEHAAWEKFGWLPKEEDKPKRWLTPFVVGWHRLRKFFAGAYRKRNVTISIYTQESPGKRCEITARVGFRWPQ